MPDEVQRLRGILLNDQGYHALCDGHFDEALELLDGSIDACRRAEDWDGEVVALQNKFVTQCRARRHRDALRTEREVLDALFRARAYPKVEQYWTNVAQSVNTLSSLREVIVIRDQHRDEDVQRAVEEHGLDNVKAADLVIVVEGQELVEVMGNLPVAERVQFFDEITHAIRREMDALGV
jgi:hypothetical protein